MKDYPLQHMADKINLPTCPVCMENLGTYGGPASLACGHNGCLKCLQELQTHLAMPWCPLCRTPFNSKLNLRLNFDLKDTLERMQTTSPIVRYVGSASLLQVVIMAIMVMLPFSPWGLSDRAYCFTLVGTGFSCSYSIYSIYGRPRAWNLQAIQLWLQSLIATKDFIYLLYCFVFVSSPMAIKFALVPVLFRSLELIAKYLRHNFSSANLYRKYVEDPCLWIDTNTATLNILSSNSKIMLGFLVIILLFTRKRNIVQGVMYWQLLKLMYHAPNTASYHRSIWEKVGMHANPYIKSLCSISTNSHCIPSTMVATFNFWMCVLYELTWICLHTGCLTLKQCLPCICAMVF